MISYLEEKNDLIAVKVSGKLEEKDYETLIPKVEEKIREYGPLNLYWEMENFDGWSASGAVNDLKLDLKHPNDFKKVAMVGDEKWQETLSGIMDVFSKAEVRFFSLNEAEKAKNWLSE